MQLLDGKMATKVLRSSLISQFRLYSQSTNRVAGALVSGRRLNVPTTTTTGNLAGICRLVGGSVALFSVSSIFNIFYGLPFSLRTQPYCYNEKIVLRLYFQLSFSTTFVPLCCFRRLTCCCPRLTGVLYGLTFLKEPQSLLRLDHDDIAYFISNILYFADHYCLGRKVRSSNGSSWSCS